MARPLKVYGTLTHRDGKQHRIIVASYTKKAAYEAMSAVSNFGSYKLWDRYTSETGNPKQLAAALPRPGVVLINKFHINQHEEPIFEEAKS